MVSNALHFTGPDRSGGTSGFGGNREEFCANIKIDANRDEFRRMMVESGVEAQLDKSYENATENSVDSSTSPNKGKDLGVEQ